MNTRRRAVLEQLEGRELLTANLWVDFGFAFPAGGLVVSDAAMGAANINGPTVDNATPPNPLFGAGWTFVPLLTTMQNLNIDLDGIPGVTLADAQTLSNDIIATMQRTFAPFDVNVQIASATSFADIAASLNANAGNDAYVLAAGADPAAPPGASPPNAALGWSLVDPGNLQDNTCIVFADTILANPSEATPAVPLPAAERVTGLAAIISHEAGHAFGLEHTLRSAPQITVGDVMHNGADHLGDVNLFTRFPLPGDPGPGTQNAYDLLMAATSIGAAPNSPAYVTGTGACDRITLTRTGQTGVTATVAAFTDNTYTTQIGTTQTWTNLDTTWGIVVEGGFGDDQIIVDASLPGGPITVRGGNGNDTLIGPNRTNTWTINGANAGALDFCGLTFIEIENLTGGTGVDTFNIVAASQPMTLDGGDGNDLFNFSPTTNNLDSITTLMIVRGNTGADAIVLNDQGTTQSANYVVWPGIVTSNLPGGVPRPFSAVWFDGTVERLTLNGTNGPNEFRITPSETTEFTINGNSPTFADPGTPPGVDFLDVDFFGTRRRKLTYSGPPSGDGKWEFLGSGTPLTGARKAVNFSSIEKVNYFPILAVGTGEGKNSRPVVRVYDAETGEIQALGAGDTLLAYEFGYRDGVRVATGDLNGDGIPEIVTAPGRNHSPVVKVFNLLTGLERTPFRTLAYAANFINGVQLAVGDVDADGWNDIVTVPSRGIAEVRVYKNQFKTSSDPILNTPIRKFRAFPTSFIGGVSIAVGNLLGNAWSEVIVGSGSGMRATINVFNASAFGSSVYAPAPARQFLPFGNAFRGGVNVALGKVNGDNTLDIIAAAGPSGASRVEILDGRFNGRTLIGSPFNAYTDASKSSEVRVVARDVDGDGRVEIFTAHGQDGRTKTIKRWGLQGPTPAAIDFLFENDPRFCGFFLG